MDRRCPAKRFQVLPVCEVPEILLELKVIGLWLFSIYDSLLRMSLGALFSFCVHPKFHRDVLGQY